MDMNNVIMITIGVLFAVLYLWLKNEEKKPQYETVSLFTEGEKAFMRSLDKAVGKEYRVFGKVRIADVLKSQKGIKQKKANSQFWKISSKHLDFVLCDMKTLDPVCAIELNDSSHNRKDRMERDIFVEEACKSAHLPLLWIKANRYYDDYKVMRLVKECIKGE